MTDVTTDAARTRYDELYQRSLSDSDAFWLEAAERLDWTRGPEHALVLREGSSFASGRASPGSRAAARTSHPTRSIGTSRLVEATPTP